MKFLNILAQFSFQIKTAFFTPRMLSETIQQLILFYLPLTAEAS